MTDKPQKTILDTIDENQETFVIINETENYLNKIHTLEDIYVELENQFEIEPELGTNRIDFLKIFCVRMLDINFKEFNIKLALRKVNSDTEHEFYKFINRLKYLLYEYFGIVFGEEIDNEVELVYLLYSTFVLYPENFLISFALYNQFYMDGFTFVEFTKEKEITELINDLGGSDDVAYDSGKYIKLIDKLNTEYNRHIDDPDNTQYTKRNNYFVQYLEYILDNLEGEGVEDLFDNLNKANPSIDWHVLHEAKDVLYQFRIEEEIFVYRLKNWYINVNSQEAMITKIAEIFFLRLKDIAVAQFNQLVKPKEMSDDEIIAKATEDYGVHQLNYRTSAREEEYYELKDPNVYIMLWSPADHWFSQGIKTVTKAEYTHSSFSFRKDLKAFFEISETVEEFQNIELDITKLDKTNRYIDIFTLEIGYEAKKKLLSLMKHFKVKFKNSDFNYSYKSVLGIFFKMNNVKNQNIDLYSVTNRHEFICSSFLIMSLATVDERIRLMVETKNYKAEHYTPKMIHDIPFIVYKNTYEIHCKQFVINRGKIYENKYRHK